MILRNSFLRIKNIVVVVPRNSIFIHNKSEIDRKNNCYYYNILIKSGNKKIPNIYNYRNFYNHKPKFSKCESYNDSKSKQPEIVENKKTHLTENKNLPCERCKNSLTESDVKNIIIKAFSNFTMSFVGTYFLLNIIIILFFYR